MKYHPKRHCNSCKKGEMIYMPNNDSHQHVVKTTSQWEERSVEYWVVPRGCLCVELTPFGKTKLKVGEGNKYFKQLPYICDHEDLSNYYTKEEIDVLLDNLNRMAIVSTDEYDSKDDLPLDGNKLGDVRFVKSTEPDSDPDIYIWNGTKWITAKSDTDLSEYVTKTEFEPVKDKVDEIYPKAHTHDNKDILDGITQADRDKFDDLHNYDDTEIRELIKETGHTHPNKEILDTITQQSILSPSDREKFDFLHNYDDTDVQNRLSDVESKAHTHDNKSVLDNITQEKMDAIDELAETYVIVKTEIAELQSKSHTHDNYYILADTTASYTVDQQNELIRLSQIGTFIGAGPDWDGVSGYVPAPVQGEETYYLRGDGTWAKVKGGGDKYKAGEGIYILSGEATADTFPFDIYSRSSQVKQYIIYGNTGGVGELVNGEYHIPVVVSAPGHPNRTSVIILSEPMYDGDYIDFEKQIFAHYRTDITSQVQHTDTDTQQTGISSSGNLYWKRSYQGWGGSPRVTDYFELESDASYEISKVYSNSDFSDSLNINLYDENKNRTRTIVTSTTTSTAFTPTENEKYMRQSYTAVQDGYCHVFKLKPTETPCILQEVVLYPNAINTIDIDTTVKPAEVYFEVLEPEDPDPDDPMSKYTGIIYNDGVLDVTQEDPNALNELTFHYRDNVDKTITIPKSELPIASDTTLGGIKVGNNLTIDPVTGVLSATGGSGGGEYIAGRGINIDSSLIAQPFSYSSFINSVTGVSRGTIVKNNDNSFTITASGDDCFTEPYNLDQGVSGVYVFSPVTGNKKYRLTWTSSDRSISGRIFVFENARSTPLHQVDQSLNEYLEFTTAETTTSLSFRFGVERAGDTLTYSNIALYLVSEDGHTIEAKLGNGLHFDSNNAITVDSVVPQYVRVNTSDSYVLLHTKPSDWDDTWYKYYTLEYDELTASPPDWDPTRHYKYENDNYVLGSPGDTFVSTTWYDKHYIGLDPNTPIIFDSDVYYTSTLNLIQDGELFDAAFEKVNEAIEHIERLEQNVQFLHDNKVDVRETVDPERIEFYYS